MILWPAAGPIAPIGFPNDSMRQMLKAGGKLFAGFFAGFAFLLLVAIVFSPELLDGDRFAGNFDRLNGASIPVRGFEAQHLSGIGSVPHWSDSVFMGLDLGGHAGIRPGWSPLSLLYSHVPTDWFMALGGAVTAALMFATFLGAYFALDSLNLGEFASITGAICYGSSCLVVARLAQGEGFAYNLVMQPWLLVLIRGSRERRAVLSLAGLTAILFLLLNYSFLQESAYVWIGITAYAICESRADKSLRPLSIWMVSSVCAVTAAMPRILEVRNELGSLSRSPSGSPGEVLSFDLAYRHQNLLPREVFRFLYDGIFGRFPSEAAAIGNNINLNEGFQVYSSTFSALLVLCSLAMLSFGRCPACVGERTRKYLLYSAIMVVSVPMLVLTRVGQYALHVAFFGLDFSHGRLVSAILLPLAILTAFAISFLGTGARRRGLKSGFVMWLTSGAAAIVLFSGLNWLQQRKMEPVRIDASQGVAKVGTDVWKLVSDGVIPIEVPRHCIAVRTKPREIRLAWEVSQRGDVEVEMKRDEHDFEVIGEAATNRYVIGDVDPEARYLFRLRRLRGDSSSAWSESFVASHFDPAVDFAKIAPLPGQSYSAEPSSWLLASALVRVVSIVLVVATCLCTWCLFGTSDGVRSWIGALLASLVVLDAATGLWVRLNGEQNRTYPQPFLSDNLFLAPPGTLDPPAISQQTIVAKRLQRNEFRTVLLEPSAQFYSVSMHVPLGWNFRTPQGGWSGVPSRLAALPWPDNVVSKRRLIFRPENPMPWTLLGQLNVKYSMTVGTEMYFNQWSDGSVEKGLSKMTISENPMPVAPRTFFVARTHPTIDFRDRHEFPVPMPKDIQADALVEGIDGEGYWSVKGTIKANYDGDHIDLSVDPMQDPRFLVMNEMFDPQWHAATEDGRVLRVYAVNTVMRGVDIPSGTSVVHLKFETPGSGRWPFVSFGLACVMLWFGGCLMADPKISPSESLRSKFRTFVSGIPFRLVSRWLLVGVIFALGNLCLLYFLVTICRITVPLATVIGFLFGSFFRFLANNKLVFGRNAFSGKHVVKYYWSIAGGGLIWYLVTNILYAIGVYYLVAAIIATSCSAGFNLTVNFKWVWRGRDDNRSLSGP